MTTNKLLLLLELLGLLDGFVDGHALLDEGHDLELALVAEGG